MLRTLYCIRRLRLVVPLCLFTGCWQEIEYREPDAGAVAAEPDATPAEAKQTVVEPEAAEVPAAAEVPTENVDGSSEVGSRYAADNAPAEDVPPSQSETEPATPTAAEPEATTVSATVESASPSQEVSSRRAAWLLGSKLGLAALAHDRNVAHEETVAWLEEARTMAAQLNTSLVELPERPATAGSEPASREVLSYLLSEGKRIGGELATNHGANHASMFEVALKSNLLLVLNKPGSAAVGHISTAIERAAPQAELPEELWRPLLDTLAQGSPPAAVRAAVREMHANVDRHLAAAAEQ
jgi:hypothetical protein